MRRFVLLLLLAGACVCAQAQQVRVYPRIETGTHTAITRRIGVDAAERFLFSASDDKTARVWDLRSGKLLKILRPPIGDGNEGRLNAIASSPDGAEVAVGGFTGKNGSGEFPVYIFDRESGAIRRTIRGLPDMTVHLTYSRDGRYLAVGLGDHQGIRIYKANGYSEVARDEKYGGNCYWLEFDKSGRLVTASWDGSVRLYSSDFRLLAKAQPRGGKQPSSARFSPDGSLIAVSFYDAMAVDVLSGNNLSFLYALETPLQEGANLLAALWSLDGQTICAGGTYYSAAVTSVLCWGEAGKGKSSAFAVAGNTITNVQALHDGAIVFCSADGRVGVLGRTGSVQWQTTLGVPDLRASGFPHVSADGNNVEVNPLSFNDARWTSQQINFSVSDESLEFGGKAAVSLRPPATSGLAVEGWKEGLHPTLDGRALQLDADEVSESLAISPDRDSFVLGTAWNLRKFDRQGNAIWSSPVPGVAWGVNITADSRFLIAALGDGTVRWYTFDTGEEVLALFVDHDLQRWVGWNPDGFFTFKNGGDALIGYQINHGPDQAGEFVKVDQLREVFYRADLIDQILRPGGTVKVLAARDRVGDISKVLASGLPPEIELASAAQAEAGEGYLLQFRVKDLGGGRGRIVYRIDGVEIEGRAVDIAGTGGDTISRYIPVGSGAHTLTVAAYSANGKILGEPRTVQLTGRQLAPGSKTSLYVVAAGITHYRDHSLWDGVKFAAADADLVAAKFQEQEGKGLYPKVTTVPLEDSRATAQGLQDAIAQAAKKVQAGDTFVLYLAGHGMAVEGEYYFIPWEAEYTNRTELLSKSLNREAIQALLKTIPTNKSVLILDTCNSGAFVEGRDAASEKAAIEKVATMSGRAVLAASNSDEMAMDGYQGHGVFTFALLKGLEAADSDAQGQILITRLAEYVQSHVPDMTEEKWHYRQRPLSAIKGDPFPIAHKAN